VLKLRRTHYPHDIISVRMSLPGWMLGAVRIVLAFRSDARVRGWTRGDFPEETGPVMVNPFTVERFLRKNVDGLVVHVTLGAMRFTGPGVEEFDRVVNELALAEIAGEWEPADPRHEEEFCRLRDLAGEDLEKFREEYMGFMLL
jgi:hypothetical protein